ncbi:hypothetical protein WJX72_006320 [[Myrmecia] bisecta]|uniref:Uncharacterized protein n=1 Tax=[Myrmecia] bisecta TaxID=41462 RepID=A0AAW1Q794_9CHLO
MQLVWDRRVKHFPGLLPDDLLRSSEPTPAFLALVTESAMDWGFVFELSDHSQRMAIYDLAFVTHGLDPVRHLSRGLSAYLMPYLAKTPDGKRYYMRSPQHRQLIQLVVSPRGEVITSWSQLDIRSSLVQLEGRCTLILLEEAADLVARGKYRGAGASEFLQDLQDQADTLDASLPWQTWPQQAWFVRAISSPWNRRDAHMFAEKIQNFKSARELYIFTLRLIRNCLAHDKPWPEQQPVDPLTNQLPPFIVEDSDLVCILPTILSKPLTEVLETMTVSLARLWQPPAVSSGSSSRGRQC